MNIYFLVEGKRTEKKVYPAWLSVLIPELEKVKRIENINQNNYFLFSGEGYPALKNQLANCVSDINQLRNIDYFVVCLDGDDVGIEKRQQEILDYFIENKILLNENTKMKIIVQNVCFETWFLGNEKIFKKNPQDEDLRKWVKFYNVKNNDPELMQKPQNHKETTADFHFNYFSKLLQERNASYNKNNPFIVIQDSFLQELIKRHQNTEHITSFGNFLNFCEEVKKAMENKEQI